MLKQFVYLRSILGLDLKHICHEILELLADCFPDSFLEFKLLCRSLASTSTSDHQVEDGAYGPHIVVRTLVAESQLRREEETVNASYVGEVVRVLHLSDHHWEHVHDVNEDWLRA